MIRQATFEEKTVDQDLSQEPGITTWFDAKTDSNTVSKLNDLLRAANELGDRPEWLVDRANELCQRLESNQVGVRQDFYRLLDSIVPQTVEETPAVQMEAAA